MVYVPSHDPLPSTTLGVEHYTDQAVIRGQNHIFGPNQVIYQHGDNPVGE